MYVDAMREAADAAGAGFNEDLARDIATAFATSAANYIEGHLRAEVADARRFYVMELRDDMPDHLEEGGSQ